MEAAHEPPAIPLDKDLLKLAFDYAWNWTNAYYDTRVRAFQFYIAASAFLVAGYITSLASRPAVATAVTLVGVVSSLAFFAIDRGAKRYETLGEKALLELEGRVAEQLNIEALRLVSHLRGESVGKPSGSSRFVWSLYLAAATGWVVVAIYTLWFK